MYIIPYIFNLATEDKCFILLSWGKNIYESNQLELCHSGCWHGKPGAELGSWKYSYGDWEGKKCRKRKVKEIKTCIYITLPFSRYKNTKNISFYYRIKGNKRVKSHWTLVGNQGVMGCSIIWKQWIFYRGGFIGDSKINLCVLWHKMYQELRHRLTSREEENDGRC